MLFTDTTMRDAHQSLLATRMRSFDITRIAQAYSRGLPNLFSLECWGGATFDVAMRFLNEDPWERLAKVRAGAPNILTQMLLRGTNGVGYTNYPDNVVKFFVAQAAKGGVDIFRVFDCLNWVENMRVSIDAVIEADKVAEGVICYTGDVLDPDRAKYDLKYYVSLAKELEAAGAHVLGLKDMAGLLKPAAAKKLIATLQAAKSACRSTSIPTTPRAPPRRRCWRRSMPGSMRSMRRWMRSPAPPASRRWARWSRRWRTASAIRGSTPRRSARSRSIGRRCARNIAPSRAICAAGLRKSICTKCPAGSSPISRSRRARWGWKRAGTRSPRPMPTSTRCSAISSR